MGNGTDGGLYLSRPWFSNWTFICCSCHYFAANLQQQIFPKNPSKIFCLWSWRKNEIYLTLPYSGTLIFLENTCMKSKWDKTRREYFRQGRFFGDGRFRSRSRSLKKWILPIPIRFRFWQTKILESELFSWKTMHLFVYFLIHSLETYLKNGLVDRNIRHFQSCFA